MNKIINSENSSEAVKPIQIGLDMKEEKHIFISILSIIETLSIKVIALNRSAMVHEEKTVIGICIVASP